MTGGPAGGRWAGGVAATLAVLALGLLFASPVVLAAGAIPLGYVAYGALSAVPRGATVTCTRRFEPDRPAPGDAVRVTIRVENAGGTALPDLRLVDGVPPDLAIRDGSPRLAAALGPGEAATCTYEVIARRGRHAFDDPLVRLRSVAGSDASTAEVAVDGDDALAAADPIETMPVRAARSVRAGRAPADRAGEGVEFFSTREYRSGDSAGRIDWRRYAKTGDLTTVEFRADRGVRTVLVLDGRAPGRVAPAAGYPTAAERCADVAARTWRALDAAGRRVETVVLGLDAADVDGPPPADGLPRTAESTRARELFRAVVERAEGGRPAGPGRRRAPGGDPDGLDRVVDGLPSASRVVLFSPLLDDPPARLARRLDAAGHPLVVASPDVGDSDSVGATLARLERWARIDEVAPLGAVVTWAVDDGPGRALDRTLGHLGGSGT